MRARVVVVSGGGDLHACFGHESDEGMQVGPMITLEPLAPAACVRIAGAAVCLLNTLSSNWVAA